jgi:undecaprenyl-diphosphatase
MESFNPRRIAAAVALLAFCAWGISLGIHTKSGISQFDQSVWQFFVDHGSSRVHSVARFVTSFGVLSVLLPVAVVVGVLVGAKSRSVATAIAPWLSVVVCAQIVTVLKKATDIVRPPSQFQVIQIRNPSFPSGHAANTTALIVGVVVVVWCVAEISRRTKMWVTIGGAVIVIAMGLTRIVLNVHWLSDVLAGWCVGAAVGLAIAGVSVAVRQLNFDA